MGLMHSLRNFTLSLTESDRQTIWRRFGSFTANMFAMNGNGLIENSYERNIDAYSVIKKQVDTLKAIPWEVVRRNNDGGFDVVDGTELHDLMSNPNPTKGYTWIDIMEMKALYLLCTGDDYTHGMRPEGMRQIAELDVLPSSAVDVQTSGNFFLPNPTYTFELDRTLEKYTNEELLHTRFFNPGIQSVDEVFEGLSPIQAAARAVQVGNDRWDADATLLQNRGAVGIVTDKSGKIRTKEEAEAIQGAFQRDTAGTRNFGKVHVSNKDLGYVQLAMSSTDLQLIEKGVVTLRALCNIYGLDSSLFNDPANKTYNNRKEAEKAMYTNAIIPLLNKFAAGFNSWLVPSYFPDSNYMMRPDLSGIDALQEDFHQKVTSYAVMKNSGIISANTAAAALNQPQSEDENADKLIVSNSLVPLEEIGTENNSTENT